jgi:glucan 1,3-beta-glucosidase
MYRNQQFTSTNLTFYNCGTAIRMNFVWTWSFRDITVNNCDVGIDMSQASGFKPDGNPFGAIGTMTLADSAFNNVGTGVVTEFNCTFQPPAAGGILIDNVDFTSATVAVGTNEGNVILQGGHLVDGWAQGPIYLTSYHTQVYPDHNNDTCWIPTSDGLCYQGPYKHPTRPAGLFDLDRDKILDRAKPTYDDWTVDQFVSAKAFGCAGDGITDDSACLQQFFDSVDWNSIAYLDHGAYVVSQQIFIPVNIRIVGEGWPLIMIKQSPIWNNINDPLPAFIVGNKGDVGKLEMQDIIFETLGPVPGAILMEWNLEEDAPGSAGKYLVPFHSTY